MLLITPVLTPFLRLVGGTESTIGLARNYIIWTTYFGGIPTTLNILLANLVRAEGKSGVASFGVSMGGMIAQHLAIDFPERVNRLILAVTSSRPNPLLNESLDEWITLAKKGDHTAFMDSNLRRIYSEDYCRKNRWMVPLIGRLTKPKSYDRFFIQADACLTHDAFAQLPCITAPTLVIGGGKDLALGPEASEEIAAEIPGARLKLYPQWGHGVYEEEPDFNRLIMDFLRE